MHAPDGFLNAGTALATGALSAGAVGAALRHTKTHLDERQIPLAGVAAAFIFAAQMINFPVAAGTTGHLLGGALAAILLGPRMGALVMTVVVCVQALAFADGGITALGYNVLNLAIVPTFGGYALFRGFRLMLPSGRSGLIGATGLAAGLSVLLAAMAFSVEWLFGATAPIPFDTVFGAMVGVHLLIAVGEAVVSALTVGAVLSARPDLVHGARGANLGSMGTSVRPRVLVIAGLLIAVFVAGVVSQFAAGGPDGLERVAQDQGFMSSAQAHPLGDLVFADYATEGISNRPLSLAIAGISGSVVALTIASGLFLAVRDRSSKRPRAGT